jgi:2-dehydropantoate 2-reductase
MDRARILVVGAGALGSFYGGFLRRAGHEVTLLGRTEHLAAIRSRGLSIEGVFGEASVRGFSLATSTDAIAGPFDLVILAVKSYDVDGATRSLAGVLAEEGALLSLENGLGHLETLAERFGRHRVLAAPVLIGSTVPAPGRVRVTVYVKPVKIGAPWSGGSLARRWAARLAEAAIPSEWTDRPMAFLWEKMLYNLPLNALGALLRAPYGVLAEQPESRRIMDVIIEEGFAVARAERVDLLWKDPGEYRRHFYETLLPPTATHRSSMLQDIERGRRTEIDAINGYVCRRGRALGIEVPQNLVLTGLVHAADAAQRGLLPAPPAVP